MDKLWNSQKSATNKTLLRFFSLLWMMENEGYKSKKSQVKSKFAKIHLFSTRIPSHSNNFPRKQGKVFPRGKLEVVLINTFCSWSFCIKIGIFLIFVSSFQCHVREGEKGKKSWGKPQQRPRKVEKRGKSHGLRELLFWGIIIEKVRKKKSSGLEKGEARSW